MSTNPPSYSPGVLSLIPLYYIGWSDNVLSPSEIKLIQKKISDFDFLTKADKEILETWANPAKPPTPQLFKQWVNLLKDTAKKLPDNSRQSLVDLGLEMAKTSSVGDEVLKWETPNTREALEELESIFEVNLDTFRNIFTKEQRAREIETVIDQPGFNVNAMTKILDDDYHELRNRIRTLLSDPVFHLKPIPVKEDFRNRVMEWCHLLAKQGLGALSYPKEYGGQDDMGSYAALFETMGYHDLSLAIKFGVQFGLFGGSVQWLGTKKHHDKYLKDIGQLKLPGCFAMTETGHGSNVRGLETTATYDKASDQFIIHSPNQDAGKEYIGNALHGRMGSVFAQLIVNGESHGVHAFLVPMRDDQNNLLPGVRVEDCGYKLGLNGVDNGRIWFDQVKIPRENLLNRFGDVDENGVYSSPIENPSKRFFTMLGTLVGGRVCVPRAGLSAAKTGLSIAIKYALKRRQFGPSDQEPETLLLDYPSHQKRLMPMLAKAYALDFALTYLTKRYTNRSEKDIREIETLAAGLKSYSTWFTTSCLQKCREACGGKGYLAENRFADLKADSDIFTTFEGDNTVLMQLVAKGLLSSFQQEFHDEGFMAVMRLLTNQITSSINTYNPISTRKSDSDHLCDTAFHVEAFQYREYQLLVSVAQRMRGLLKKRMNSYDAFLRCQTHLIELAHAFIERIVLEQFVDAVNKCEDESCKKILKKLCDLFALSTIQENKGWYLEQDYMQGAKTKAIRKMVDKLCKDVRSEAAFLVDAFAIPESCIAAPIVL